MLDVMSETWLPIAGFAGYSVSSRGRVRGPNGLKKAHVSGGYLRVCLYRGGSQFFRTVHMLVARTFLGPCPVGHIVNHKDGNKCNPSLSNLEYATYADNTQHAIKLGLLRWTSGAARPNATLSDKKVVEIFTRVAAGQSRAKIAKRFGIGKTVLNLIVLRRDWRHVRVDPNLVRRAQAMPHGNRGDGNPVAKLKAANIISIFRLAKQGTQLLDIATRFGVTRSLISSVLHRKVWGHVSIPKELVPTVLPSRRLVWN